MIIQIVFINRSSIVHNNKYNYEKVKYRNANSKVEIICPNHKSFWQEPYVHLQGSGCPKCSSSKGEKEVRKCLENLGLSYKEQYKIKECKNKRSLPFDFAVFTDSSKSKIKFLIEYDGEQHFEADSYLHKDYKSFLSLKDRDCIKSEYCADNDIVLLRIPYWGKEMIDMLIEELNNQF